MKCYNPIIIQLYFQPIRSFPTLFSNVFNSRMNARMVCRARALVVCSMMMTMTMMTLVAADTTTSDSSVTIDPSVTGDAKLEIGDIMTPPAVTTITDSGLARSFGPLLMAVMAVMHL